MLTGIFFLACKLFLVPQNLKSYPIIKKKKKKKSRAGRVAQVLEHLPSKCEASVQIFSINDYM
jgi:hypothetical protein